MEIQDYDKAYSCRPLGLMVGDVDQMPISILEIRLRQTHTSHISQKNSSKEVSYVQEGAALEV